MFCSNCGSKVEDGLNFCPNCGTKIEKSSAEVKTESAGENTVFAASKMTFGKALKLYFSNLFNFSGKAGKSEFWWCFLFNAIFFVLFELIDLVISSYLRYHEFFFVLVDLVRPSYLFYPLGIGGVLQILLVLMGTSIAVRRMHDIEKPGILVLLYLIPLIIYASSMIPLDTFKDPKIIYGGAFLFLIGGIVFLIFAAKTSKS